LVVALVVAPVVGGGDPRWRNVLPVGELDGAPRPQDR